MVWKTQRGSGRSKRLPGRRAASPDPGTFDYGSNYLQMGQKMGVKITDEQLDQAIASIAKQTI